MGPLKPDGSQHTGSPFNGKLKVIEENDGELYKHQGLPLELEVDVLRREREILLQRIGELEQHEPTKEPSPTKETEPTGIIHSVHIRTGNSAILGEPPKHPKPGLSRLKPDNRSVSHNDLLNDGGVQIEIKGHPHHLARQMNKAKSQDYLANKQQQTAVSVVSLRTSNESSPRSSSPLVQDRGRTGSFGGPRATKSSLLLPSRMGLGKKPLTTSKKAMYSKSKSVENLQQHPVALGLKPANSEMALIQKPGQDCKQRSRLKGTHSEMNVSRIGVTEKLCLNPLLAIEGNASMPADLTQNAAMVSGLSKAASVPIKPNRDKIRAVLAMSNVIELQRHLLTTVMENEVRWRVMDLFPTV